MYEDIRGDNPFNFVGLGGVLLFFSKKEIWKCMLYNAYNASVSWHINRSKILRQLKNVLFIGCCSTIAIGCNPIKDLAAHRSISESIFQHEISTKVNVAKEQTKPNFIIRAGDSLTQSLLRLSQITGTVYVINKDDDETRKVELTTQSQPITNWEDMKKYLEILGYTANLSPLGGASQENISKSKSKASTKVDKPESSKSSEKQNSPIFESESLSEKSNGTGGYMRVSVHEADTLTQIKASKECKTKLIGAFPLGMIVNDICHAASVTCRYGDTGASAYTGVVYPMAFEGSCADAFKYVGQKANLAVKFSDKDVEFRMMDTATIDLGIPLRDRKVALDIIATSSSTNNGNSSSDDTSSASAVGSGKGLQSGYQTNYYQSIRAVMESMRTPFGTWNYFPETGQIFVRDRAEAVSAIKTTLNRMAQAFQSRFGVTLTLYRINVSNGTHISSTLIKTINNKISFSLGVADLIEDPQGTLTSGSNSGKTNSVITALSELGNVETIDTYTMTLQAGIPQTLKVAKNTEYVRNISTTSVATSGSVSSSVDQANATDGSFLTVQARQAESGKIAVDYGVFINQLEGFDETETETTTVKSQKGYERTFDTTSVVEDGVPYVATLVSSRNRNDVVSSVPGLDKLGFLGALFGGDKSDSMNNSYIAVVVEAVRQ